MKIWLERMKGEAREGIAHPGSVYLPLMQVEVVVTISTRAPEILDFHCADGCMYSTSDT